MVTPSVVDEQLNRIGFKQYGWGKGEVKELPHILLPDEVIFEAANGYYDGGFALLLATDVRVLLIDKKPFKFLTVEDLRFDMINEIDYSHRMIGASISISTGSKNLVFQSINQPKLRKLIGHVQDCMASSKKQQQYHQEDQNQHLEEINKRLQAYLIAQHQHQEELQNHLKKAVGGAEVELDAPKPSNELADYLYAQSLLAKHNIENSTLETPIPQIQLDTSGSGLAPPPEDIEGIKDEGSREVFGKRIHTPTSLNPLPTLSSAVHRAIGIKYQGRNNPVQATETL